MGKRNLPDSENLVAECFDQHKNLIHYTHAGKNSQLDVDGTDFIVDFKIDQLFFPLSLRLQVKTNNNGSSIALLLPIPNSINSKLNRRVLDIIHKHHSKHPHVNFILFVGLPGEGEEFVKQKVLDSIWKEMQRIFEVLKKHYLKIINQ